MTLGKWLWGLCALALAWRAKLAKSTDAHVTVRTEEESLTIAPTEAFATDGPALGIWRDREDTADVVAYVRKLRAPRYNRDGSHSQSTSAH